MRVLVFGASITQGFWDSRGGWVGRLREHYDKKQLQDLKQNDEPTVFNLGISGDTLEDIIERFDSETKARIFRGGEVAFVFSVGTNNAAAGEERTPAKISDYVQGLAKLVAMAQKYSGKIMMVGLPPCDEPRTTPVFWRNIHYTNARIAAIDKAMEDFCSDNRIKYVKVRHLFENREAELLPDGLHPNNEGHQLIYEAVKPELDKLLAQ